MEPVWKGGEGAGAYFSSGMVVRGGFMRGYNLAYNSLPIEHQVTGLRPSAVCPVPHFFNFLLVMYLSMLAILSCAHSSASLCSFPPCHLHTRTPFLNAVPLMCFHHPPSYCLVSYSPCLLSLSFISINPIMFVITRISKRSWRNFI